MKCLNATVEMDRLVNGLGDAGKGLGEIIELFVFEERLWVILITCIYLLSNLDKLIQCEDYIFGRWRGANKRLFRIKGIFFTLLLNEIYWIIVTIFEFIVKYYERKLY